MNTTSKIAAGVATIGIVGAGIVGLNLQNCGGDDEKLAISGNETCFAPSEYKNFKDEHIQELKNQGNIYFWKEQGRELLDIINHEIKKNKGFEMKDVKSPQEAIDNIIKFIQ